jgi:photosystem II stability/assembly factor-like uncharacterized protein
MKSSNFLYLLRLIVLFPILITYMTGCEKTDSSEKDQVHAGGFHAQVIKHTDKLYDVAAPGGGKVWIVGYFGSIFCSEDNGLHWTRKDAGAKESLLGVHFPNEKEGWIVGDQGIILHTADGGETWERQESPVTDQKLLKVQFVDEKQGWIAGTYGLILHTNDGGENWKRLPFDEDVILNDLCFIDSMRGWLAGEFGFVFYTEDGGKSWDTQLEDEMGRKLFGIDFSDELNGIAVGNEGVIYTTGDGGKTWELKENGASDTLLKVAFSDNIHAAAVGLRGCFYATDDGGDNWKSVCPVNHFTWLSGVAFDKNGRGFAVGDGGKIYINTNKSLNWAPYNQRAGS